MEKDTNTEINTIEAHITEIKGFHEECETLRNLLAVAAKGGVEAVKKIF